MRYREGLYLFHFSEFPPRPPRKEFSSPSRYPELITWVLPCYAANGKEYCFGAKVPSLPAKNNGFCFCSAVAAYAIVLLNFIRYESGKYKGVFFFLKPHCRSNLFAKPCVEFYPQSAAFFPHKKGRRHRFSKPIFYPPRPFPTFIV